jgi:hypothetical protein
MAKFTIYAKKVYYYRKDINAQDSGRVDFLMTIIMTKKAEIYISRRIEMAKYDLCKESVLLS